MTAGAAPYRSNAANQSSDSITGRRGSLMTANVIEFEMLERRRSTTAVTRSARASVAVSRVDLSELIKKEPPVDIRARTAAVRLKGESMLRLNIPQNLSPSIFPQIPDGVSKDPSKDLLLKRTKSAPMRRDDMIGIRPPSISRIARAADLSQIGPEENRIEPDTHIQLRSLPTTERNFRNKAGRLKSARLSVYLGRNDPKKPEQSKTVEEKKQEGIYSLLDRGMIPHGSDYTGYIKLMAETAPKSKRPLTVPAPFGRNMFEPLVEPSAIVPRPKTTDRPPLAQQSSDPKTMHRDLRNSLSIYSYQSHRPSQVQHPDQYGQNTQGISNGLQYMPTGSRGAPTPCPTDCPVVPQPHSQDYASRRFVRLQPPQQRTSLVTSHKQYIISLGRLTRDSEAFKHFIILASQSYPLTLIDFVIDKIEKFFASYSVRWVECSFEKTLDLLSIPGIAVLITNDHIMSIVVNEKDVMAEMSTPGQRFHGEHGRLVAILRIQAAWRMQKLRKIHINFVLKLRAGEKFRQKWYIRRMIRDNQISCQKRHLEYLARYRVLRDTFRAEWPSIRNKKRVVIHLPSISFNTVTRSKYDSMHHWEIRQLGRLVDLLDPNVSVVYITPMLAGEVEKFFKQTITYSIDLSELIRSKRLLILNIKRPNFCMQNVSLASLFLCSTSAVKRISDFIQDMPAYLVPAVCGRPELDIACTLNIPIFSSFEACTEFSHRRTAQRRLICNSLAPHPPGASEFKNETHFYEQLDELIQQYPQFTRWLFKVDGEMECRGLAYLDVSELRSCVDSTTNLNDDDEAGGAETAAGNANSSGNVNNAGGATTTRLLFSNHNASDCQHPLKDKVYQCVHFSRKDLWTSWSQYLKKFLTSGGVIEANAPAASPEESGIEYPVVHQIIEPDGNIRVLATSSQIFLQPYKLWGSVFPQNSVSHNKLVANAELIARECYQKGIIGHVSCEFVTWKLRDMFEATIWCTSVKPHFNDNLAQAYYILMTSCCPAQYPDGKIYFNLNIARRLNLRFISKVPYVDMQRVRKTTNTEHIEDELDLEERVGLYTTRISHQSLDVMDAKVFNGLCIESGITFDGKWKFGTLLPMFEDFSKQNCAMVCINRSFESTLDMFLQNIVIIARRLTGTMTVYSNFMEICQHLMHILTNSRPFSYVHKPAVVKGINRLSSIEVVLNKHITLPLARMAGFLNLEDDPSKSKDEKSSKRGLSSTSINLLNAGIPSKALSGFYPEFGREKIDTSSQARMRSPTRVPPGLPMDEYMAIMEHLAGLDDEEGDAVAPLAKEGEAIHVTRPASATPVAPMPTPVSPSSTVSSPVVAQQSQPAQTQTRGRKQSSTKASGRKSSASPAGAPGNPSGTGRRGSATNSAKRSNSLIARQSPPGSSKQQGSQSAINTSSYSVKFGRANIQSDQATPMNTADVVASESIDAVSTKVSANDTAPSKDPTTAEGSSLPNIAIATETPPVSVPTPVAPPIATEPTPPTQLEPPKPTRENRRRSFTLDSIQNDILREASPEPPSSTTKMSRLKNVAVSVASATRAIHTFTGHAKNSHREDGGGAGDTKFEVKMAMDRIMRSGGSPVVSGGKKRAPPTHHANASGHVAHRASPISKPANVPDNKT